MMIYGLLVVLDAACSVSPILAIGGIAYCIASLDDVRLAFACGIASAVLFVLKKPIDRAREDAMMKVEYDEHGRSRKKGTYKKLAKQEREAIDLQKTADMERIISTTALERMTSEGSRTPDEDLEALVGLAPVKQKTREMVARMKFENDERKERKKSRKKRAEKETVFSEGSRHMCFFGNPGTGKTTVARIITGFLFRYGYIRKNRIVEIDGNTLKAGEYTAAKTEIIIEHALGGVLFIDEAYALMSGLGSDEAIATLIKQMEDHRGDFILIIAGYSDEMRALIQTNPGFSSRIKEYLDFPDYSDNEMVDILRLMAKERHFTVGNDAIPPFLDRIDSERALRSFGNARTVRNILDESLDRHALNFMNGAIAESRRYEICEPDVSRQLKRIAI